MVKSSSSSRIISFDTMKVWAALFVVVIHAQSLMSVNDALYGVVRNFARWAVPFFFLAAGYFFALKIKNPSDAFNVLGRYVGRLTVFLLGWSLFYYLVPQFFVLDMMKGDTTTFSSIYSQGIQITENSISVLWQFISPETFTHLWFFPALIMGVSLWAVIVRMGWASYALFWSVLFLFLALGLVTIFSSALPESYYWGNGPFWSVSFMAFGWWAAKSKPVFSLKSTMGVVLVGLLVRFVEVRWLMGSFYHDNGGGWVNLDQLTLGSSLMGIGFFMLCLAKPQFGKGSFWAKLAPLSLGIYVLHPFWLNNTPNVLSELMPAWLWSIVQVMIAFGLSAVCAWVLRRWHATRWLVQ